MAGKRYNSVEYNPILRLNPPSEAVYSSTLMEKKALEEWYRKSRKSKFAEIAVDYAGKPDLGSDTIRFRRP